MNLVYAKPRGKGIIKMKAYDLSYKYVSMRIIMWLATVVILIIVDFNFIFQMDFYEQGKIVSGLLIAGMVPLLLFTGLLGGLLGLIKELAVIVKRKNVLILDSNFLEYYVPFLGYVHIDKDNVENVSVRYSLYDHKKGGAIVKVIYKNPIENFKNHKFIYNFMSGILLDNSDDKVIKINVHDIKCNRDEVIPFIKNFDPYFSKKDMVINKLMEKSGAAKYEDLINNKDSLNELIKLLRSECNMTQADIAAVTNQKIKTVSKVLNNF